MSNNLSNIIPMIPASSDEGIDALRKVEDKMLEMEQVKLTTSHLLHGGLYVRTVIVPKGCLMAGALIRVPTTIIMNGHVSIFTDAEQKDFSGYNIIPGSAGRKQAFYTHEDTIISMIFPTSAKTVKEAEDEFTEESGRLASRDSDAINHITITEE